MGSTYGRDQAEVLSAVARYAKAHHIPPLDRGLRSIVAQQIANLLKGGWKTAEIKAAALDIVSRYDRFNGHKQMTQLQRLVEIADEARDEDAHMARQRTEKTTPIAPEVVALLPVAAWRSHPSTHAFNKSAQRDTCALCDGPLGVHVRELGLDPDGQPILVSTGVA